MHRNTESRPEAETACKCRASNPRTRAEQSDVQTSRRQPFDRSVRSELILNRGKNQMKQGHRPLGGGAPYGCVAVSRWGPGAGYPLPQSGSRATAGIRRERNRARRLQPRLCRSPFPGPRWRRVRSPCFPAWLFSTPCWRFPRHREG